MCNALVLAADPAEAPRAAGWLGPRLAALGMPASRAVAAARRLEAAWAELVALYRPHARASQMILLTVGGGAGAPAVELVAERRGRIPPATADRAARLGLVALPAPGIEGLTRLAFAV
jgi:hypothetical protein